MPGLRDRHESPFSRVARLGLAVGRALVRFLPEATSRYRCRKPNRQRFGSPQVEQVATRLMILLYFTSPSLRSRSAIASAIEAMALSDVSVSLTVVLSVQTSIAFWVE
jgi:hypothetical protein